MKSPLIKRSVVVCGRKTSISLEDEFWNGLKEIAEAQGQSLAQTELRCFVQFRMQ